MPGPRALLDVNVLIALLDAGHAHHAAATDWLARHGELGWATCPITQAGCIRVMANPAYPQPLAAAAVAGRLAAACADADHAFWPDTVSLVEGEAVDWRRLLGHRQVTDACLLALAVRNEGRFATFDRGVPLAAVRGARETHVVVI